MSEDYEEYDFYCPEDYHLYVEGAAYCDEYEDEEDEEEDDEVA